MASIALTAQSTMFMQVSSVLESGQPAAGM